MVDIPESLLRRSAEAKAKALGVPVEEVLAEMKGEGPRGGSACTALRMRLVLPPSDEDTSDATDAEQGESTPEAGPEEEEIPAAVEEPLPEAGSEEEKVAAAVATAVEETPPEAGEAEGNGSGKGKVAGLVRPTTVCSADGVSPKA